MQWLANRHAAQESGLMTIQNESVHTKGLVLHSQARYYDLLAWLLTLGRERAFRERLVELARLQQGEAVLDVGCGTGTLAIAAKKRVGHSGTVVGIDASREMIELSQRKAKRAGVEVRFETAIVEALPFSDASFDVVFSTLMLHHLPRPAREQCAREIRRVLKPGGRVLAVDFATPARQRKGLLARLHRHGHMALREIIELLSGAALQVEEFGAVGVSDLQFVAARVPDPNDTTTSALPATARSMDPLPAPRWLWVVLVAAIVIAHALVIGRVTSHITLPIASAATVVVLILLMHSTFIGIIHTLLRRWRTR
jgi:ubiquinone/menaquinone biosynthesis C-methylase UbiE